MYARIIDRSVYHIDCVSYETAFECDHDEEGWYVELSFSDGNHDVTDPMKQKRMLVMFLTTTHRKSN